jgi:hypothetical protein
MSDVTIEGVVEVGGNRLPYKITRTCSGRPLHFDRIGWKMGDVTIEGFLEVGGNQLPYRIVRSRQRRREPAQLTEDEAIALTACLADLSPEAKFTLKARAFVLDEFLESRIEIANADGTQRMRVLRRPV